MNTSLQLREAPAEVLAIYAYGSLARGDRDEFSDADICVIHLGAADEQELRGSVLAACSDMRLDRTDLSLYDWPEFQRMLASGSLFGWHLALEGVALFDPQGLVARALRSVAPYRRAVEDLCDYQLILRDVGGSLRQHGSNPYDLALLFTIARNTAMVLSVSGGYPAFGRSSVFPAAEAAYRGRFSFCSAVYDELLAWKLWYTRAVGSRPATPTDVQVGRLTRHVERMLDFALEVAHDLRVD